MTSHFLLMVVFAFFVSLVFAVLLRDEPRAQLRTGAMMFGGFVAAALVIGWLMFPLPLGAAAAWVFVQSLRAEAAETRRFEEVRGDAL